MAYYPLIVLTTLAGLKALDRRLEEAASLIKRPTVVWRTITLPLLSPYIATGAVFVFLFSLFNYGVPALLNLQTYPVEIFAQFSAFYNEGRAAALACPLIMTALVLLWLMQKNMKNRSYFTISSGSTPDNAEPVGRIETFLSITAWSVITISVFVPLATLLVQTASWKVLSVVLKTSFAELATTLLLSAAAALALVLIAYPLADAISRAKSGIWKWLNFFTLLPFAIPATVLGIGLVYVWNRPYLDRVYSSAVILAIAFIARFLPFAVRAMAAGFSQIAPNLREAALLHECSDFRRWFKIERPLIQRSMAVSWLIGFILCMNELGATLLVIPPGYGTLSLKIYNLMHYGANQMVAGMALLLVVINLAAAGIVSMIFITKKVRHL
jgi:iron(III) transport system permease protein